MDTKHINSQGPFQINPIGWLHTNDDDGVYILQIDQDYRSALTLMD